MMKFQSFIFIACLCLHNFKNAYSKEVCEKPISPEGEVGPFINIPNQFYFNLEATFEDKKEVTSFVEYYDHPGLRGLITQKENGDQESIYYSFQTNEVFTVKDSFCTVSDLGTDQNTLIIGQPGNGSAVMFSPARMLFLEDRGVYMGTVTIRGIPCFHWKSCQEWKMLSAKMNVNWYFAVDNYWSTAQSSNYHIPVRCDVDGIAKFTPFHHIYDFFHFRSGLPDDPTIFEVSNLYIYFLF
uniref:LolA-like domain-containing protein n=2 Tax=Octopus bimaculoides TaxID=37653 RepID=A0A0L8I4C1_OCTBM